MHTQAVLISGAQGTGKTTMAREIAEEYGYFEEIELHQLLSPFGLGQAMHDDPAALIVEGFPVSLDDRQRIKSLVTMPEWQVNQKGKELRVCKAAKLIFVTLLDVDKTVEMSRRYEVIRL